jgi:GrpB-like predicted nucleotidyltransferase (UPF0157 family)
MRLEVAKIEEQLHGKLLFNVRAFTAEGRMDLPVTVLVQGSPALEEAAAFRSVLALAAEILAAVRARLA